MGGRSAGHRRLGAGIAALALVAPVATGCGGSTGSDGATTSTTAAASTGQPSGGSSSTTSTPSPTVTEVPTTVPALADASLSQRSAPPDGTGTALLRAVRVGTHAGFDRIVFEFEGSSVPGYRVQWTDQPIVADGSGEPVEVDGAAHLEMVLQPASGVDLSAPDLRVTYDGPDRVATDGAAMLTDLVRTGDFEAVLTWVAGARRQVPFRVITLRAPTRVVVDVTTSA